MGRFCRFPHAIMGPNSSHLGTNVANVSARWLMSDPEGHEALSALFGSPNLPGDAGNSPRIAII
jgi:hypothetical protein